MADHRILNVPELIPVRMLNEFAYCPRLAYLEWAQGEFVHNLETLEGRFGHRRVDQPGTAQTGGDESGNTIHARSVMISAPGEGLICKLDLLELEGKEATPVDYKRGRQPDRPEGAWEPDRVQVCAQGLILREAGYHSDAGVLYFLQSKRRVPVVFDDILVARTRELVAGLRRMGEEQVMPPPLVDSPKCPRCSLVGICLPDETNLLRQMQETADAENSPIAADHGDRVRKLLPARDDALPLYIQEQGASLGKSGDRLTIKSKGELIQTLRLIDVSQVSLFGNVQVTSQALRTLASRGVPVCHFSYGGWLSAITAGLVHKNVELRIRQFSVAADTKSSLKLARQFIVGKIKNCRTLLRRHLPREHGVEPAAVLAQLAELAEQAGRASCVETLLGTEGMAAKLYFAGFAKLLKGGAEFDIEGRNRRPPKDPTNALLSFVYSMLARELTVVLQAVGFDPLLGFLHRPRYGRPSLALDLAEEFRPLLADSTVLTLVNNGEVSAESFSFIQRGSAAALTAAGRRAVIQAFERRLETEVTHPLFGYRVSYRRILEVQARLLSRVLLGELAEYPSFCTR